MNIAILSESCFPVINGVSASTDILFRGLAARGHRVTVIAPDHPDAADTEGVLRTGSVILKPAKDYPLPSLSGLAGLEDMLAGIRPDVIHAQIPFIYGLQGKRIARKLGVPFVSVSHTLYPEYVHYVPFAPGALAAFAVKKYLARFYSSCDAVATPSAMMKVELMGYGVKREIKIIPTGIRLPAGGGAGDMRESLGIPRESRVLVYMSRVAKEKNLDLLTEACAGLQADYPGLTLLVIGGGPYLEHMKRQAAAGGYRCVFTGMVENSRIYDYLRCGDIFVFPSVTETQGLAVCEAQAAGLPVVAVRAGGVPENVVENRTGFLTGNSAEDFAGRIRVLLDNQELRRYMSRWAAAHAANFSIDSMLDRYEAFYRGALEKRAKEQ
ncbi:MAG: glycosyltransferase [Abditibacteriota bacterium]|nr:glycosyltransferase [Abditibacteriota bacterium]